MDIDAALDAAMDKQVRRGPACSMGAVLTQMPEETVAKVLQILTQPRPDGQLVPSTIISDILIQYGWPVKPDAVMRHRRSLLGKSNGCACGT